MLSLDKVLEFISYAITEGNVVDVSVNDVLYVISMSSVYPDGASMYHITTNRYGTFDVRYLEDVIPASISDGDIIHVTIGTNSMSNIQPTRKRQRVDTGRMNDPGDIYVHVTLTFQGESTIPDSEAYITAWYSSDLPPVSPCAISRLLPQRSDMLEDILFSIDNVNPQVNGLSLVPNMIMQIRRAQDTQVSIRAMQDMLAAATQLC